MGRDRECEGGEELGESERESDSAEGQGVRGWGDWGRVRGRVNMQKGRGCGGVGV